MISGAPEMPCLAEIPAFGLGQWRTSGHKVQFDRSVCIHYLVISCLTEVTLGPLKGWNRELMPREPESGCFVRIMMTSATNTGLC